MKLLDRALFKYLKVERSYAQSGEDKILRHLFNNLNKEKIRYLDIGTNHPVVSNNTYLFYRSGSSGVCIEPNPAFGELIRRYRPRDVYLQIGVAKDAKTEAEFYVMSAHTLSTFSREDVSDLERSGKHRLVSVIKVPVRTVGAVLKEYFEEPPDLVSIDAEGFSEQIIRSFDFSQFRPFCFCVETITFSENGTGEKIHGIFDVFERNGYDVYADTRINTIFVNRTPAGVHKRTGLRTT